MNSFSIDIRVQILDRSAPLNVDQEAASKGFLKVLCHSPLLMLLPAPLSGQYNLVPPLFILEDLK